MIKNIVTVKHGSHLYGLATPTSDLDLYTVYDFTHKNHRPNRQVTQVINEETDHLKISLEKFSQQVIKGVPQALEVLFADREHFLDYNQWDWYGVTLTLEPQLEANMVGILDTYRRTIINFFAEDNFKKNRHGFRLLWNAEALKAEGRFNPTLNKSEVYALNKLAELPVKERQEQYKDMLFEVFG